MSPNAIAGLSFELERIRRVFLRRERAVRVSVLASRRILQMVVICGCILLGNQWVHAQVANPSPCALALQAGSATGCGVLISVTAVDTNGAATSYTITSQGNGNPYDGDDDTLVGIVNNTASNLISITLTSADTTFGGLFGFDGDGPCTYNTNDCYGGDNSYGYEGPDNTFNNIIKDDSGNAITGTVNFTTPIQSGSSTWFALEGTPQSISTTLTVTELGLGSGTVTDGAMLTCSESGGVMSGTCSLGYPAGTAVYLTATAGTGSAFGSWSSNCTVTESGQCMVTMSTSQTVTASFVAGQTMQSVMIPPGTNMTTQAVTCPNGSYNENNQCTDPNGNAVNYLFPNVPSGGLLLNIYTTEFDPNGLCPSGGTVTSDFDCRFLSFFNYGTDGDGNTITPYCWPYANGDCVTYKLLKQDGTALEPTDFTGPLYWTVTLNADSFTPPDPWWTGGVAPRMLDDPDEDEFTPQLPYGTNCSAPMQFGTPGTEYLMNGQPIFCQFDADITTAYNSSQQLDSGIGGRTAGGNEVVVAFLPTSTRNGNSPPANSAPTIAGSCPNGCTVNGSSSTITFTEGTGGTFDANPTGYPAPTLTEAGALPSGLTFNMVAGTITGTPADGTAGNYPIALSAANGVIPPANAAYTLVVSPALLTITASSATMTDGGTVPTIIPSYSGFVNRDMPLNLTTQPTCKTTATITSLPGSYPSACSGAVDPTYTINYVNGTVTVGALQISSSVLNFGTLYLHGAGAQGVVLTNRAKTPITISSVKTGLPGTAVSDYGSISFCPPLISSMPGTLPAGKSCLIVVGILANQPVYSPTASTATLAITDNSAGSPQLVLLTTEVINPQATLSTSSINFPTQNVGTTIAANPVTLTNTGTTSLNLTTVSISGDFALASGTTCSKGGTVAAGSPCLIDVTFTPKAKGVRTGSVTITDNALSRAQVISLVGIGR